jgi:hypothetical protein
MRRITSMLRTVASVAPCRVRDDRDHRGVTTFLQHLDRDAVAARAAAFPRLAALSATRVARVLDGHPVAASKASALLQLLEESGEQMLRRSNGTLVSSDGIA